MNINVKKISKIISAVLIITTILSAFCMVFANETGPDIPSPSRPTSGATEVNNIAGMVIYVIQIIAFAAAVIMLIFVGIKFLTASPEGKAEIKKTAVIYVVGAILLFAATGILQIVRMLANNISGTVTVSASN